MRGPHKRLKLYAVDSGNVTAVFRHPPSCPASAMNQTENQLILKRHAQVVIAKMPTSQEALVK